MPGHPAWLALQKFVSIRNNRFKLETSEHRGQWSLSEWSLNILVPYVCQSKQTSLLQCSEPTSHLTTGLVLFPTATMWHWQQCADGHKHMTSPVTMGICCQKCSGQAFLTDTQNMKACIVWWKATLLVESLYCFPNTDFVCWCINTIKYALFGGAENKLHHGVNQNSERILYVEQYWDRYLNTVFRRV
jgi:hypothetical protein